MYYRRKKDNSNKEERNNIDDIVHGHCELLIEFLIDSMVFKSTERKCNSSK